MKKTVLGILAHVDAGKTTLSEALLTCAGALRKAGRVDHGDAFLDTDALERARGITIFSKQARFATKQLSVTLIDTPGHTDFSAEMERALLILDCAILVINGNEGIQPHTETLWRLLRQKKIPTFLFVNKTDLPGFDRKKRLDELHHTFGSGCVDFLCGSREAFFESCAACDETLLERYLETDALTDEEISAAIAKGSIFPCYFGSALHQTGIDELLNGLEKYVPLPCYGEEFAAQVYKISRDAQQNRLTYLKITGGTLPVRTSVTYAESRNSSETVTEKVNQIRLYSGAKFESVQEAAAGDVCAVLGLSKTWPGQGLGAEPSAFSPTMEPVMSYRVLPPEDCDPRVLLPKLLLLEEESPQLHIIWDDALREIRAQLMGDVDIEVFCHQVSERFGIDVTVDAGQILYRETIAAPVEGVGHYEPLRHYAEVHLLLKPLERGSGIQVLSNCPEEVLDRAWQRTVLSQLEEKVHRGVLTGSPLTDVRITLIAGRAHLKHSEPADFRQAAYRAVRQGLMKAQNILLEPFSAFRLAVPFEQTGRAITDLHAMGAVFSQPEDHEGKMLLRGRAPLAAMRTYALEIASYTHGQGRLSCEPDGFEPCKNQADVVKAIGYDPRRDLENTPDSVFFSHGAGTVIEWDHVEELMHLQSAFSTPPQQEPRRLRTGPLSLDDRELQAIFLREFGPPRSAWQPPKADKSNSLPAVPEPPRRETLIVDGYNVLFAWEELRSLAQEDLDAARRRLLDILANYSAYLHRETAVIFDAYRVSGHREENSDYHGLHVFYTKQGETADLYIERLAGEIGKNDTVRVVTSDSLIQLSALRSGVLRMSSRELHDDVLRVEELIAERLDTLRQTNRTKGASRLTFPGKS